MKIILFIVLFALCSSMGFTQIRHVTFDLAAQAGTTSKGSLPFWMRSNKFGSIPLAGPSAGLIGGFKKDYQSDEKRLFDWGAGAEVRANLGKGSDFILTQGYLKIKTGVLELLAGRVKEGYGISDTLFSSGNFALSGNALGVPKIQISIPEFYSIPAAGKFFAIKGSFAHGRMGNLPIQFPYKRVSEAKSYLHQKSIYLRLGIPESKVKAYLGANDNAIWGNNEKIFPKNEFMLSPWQEYSHVVLGKRFEYSQVGNHLGTVDLALEYQLKKFRIMAYRQSFIDKDALGHLANILDGLNGVTFTRTENSSRFFSLDKIVLEALYTKNQAVDSWKRLKLLGYEDYYNNYIYTEGWSYKGVGLGTPFITPENLAKENLTSDPAEYFINNRVLAYHAGLSGNLKSWTYNCRLSYSLNFGTYATENTFGKKKQLSVGITLNKEIAPKLQLAFEAAADKGELYPSSSGLQVKLAKTFSSQK